jgi:hypothetical protein
VVVGHVRRDVMSGHRGATSGSPRHPLLSADHDVTVEVGAACLREPHPRGGDRDDRDDVPVRVSVEEHRETVVRRLLARGLSPTAIAALLPDFRPLVQRLADEE